MNIVDINTERLEKLLGGSGRQLCDSDIAQFVMVDN